MSETNDARIGRLEGSYDVLLSEIKYLRGKFDEVLVKYAEMKGREMFVKSPLVRTLLTILTVVFIPLIAGGVGATIIAVKEGLLR